MWPTPFHLARPPWTNRPLLTVIAMTTIGLSAPRWALADPQGDQTQPGTLTAVKQNSCASDLTCGRETRVPSAKNIQRLVPDLSQWEPIRLAQSAAPIQVRETTHRGAYTEPTTGMAFARIAGACYQIPPVVPSAQPLSHPVASSACFASFDLGSHEVTFAEYDRFAQATERELPDDNGWGRGSRPVINVSVYDAMAFATWLGRKSGETFRLPTEMEWEHAARAGSRTLYPWGNDLGINQANCNGCGSRWDGIETAPVGSFAPNAWGLYDMIGNVAEWTCSIRDPDPAQSFENCDSPYASRRRVYRNGGWSDGPERLGANFRDWNAGIRKTDFVGFRLLRECSECDTTNPRPILTTSPTTPSAGEEG